MYNIAWNYIAGNYIARNYIARNNIAIHTIVIISKIFPKIELINFNKKK